MRSGLVRAAVAALALPLALAVAAPASAAPAASTAVVKGHVVSPSGRAIAGVQVSVYADTGAGRTVVRRVGTSRTGRYELQVPAAARGYKLKVLDHGDADRDEGDGTWAPVLRRIAVPARSVVVDQVLHRGARVTGRAYDRTGKPVRAGLMVTAESFGTSVLMTRTYTRADGTYRFSNLPAGPNRIAFVSPRSDEEGWRFYSSASVHGANDGSLPGTTLELASGGRTTGIDVRFPYLGRVAGRVTVDGAEPTKATKPAVTATLMDGTGRVLRSGLARPAFDFSALDPGSYLLRFEPHGAGPGRIVPEFYRDAATQADAVPLVVTERGNAITGLRVALGTR